MIPDIANLRDVLIAVLIAASLWGPVPGRATGLYHNMVEAVTRHIRHSGLQHYKFRLSCVPQRSGVAP